MQPDAQLVDVLKRLAAGQFEPEEWLKWWEDHADRIAGLLKRGQWLRLKPPQPGGYGPPNRCTLVSQQEAINLLASWGIEHECSDRYQVTWQADFEYFVANQERDQTQNQKQFAPQLNCLKTAFPKFAHFLSTHLKQIEELDVPATDEQIKQLEHAFDVKLPPSYRRFLKCSRSLVYGDFLRLGLPYTFRHPDQPELPSAGGLCFGEYWLEGDGDQVLFGDREPNLEPCVLYYDHSIPSVRVLAEDFTAWTESLPDTLAE